ncbi:MAG: branched-chain amino acid ABC transporter permease [Alphaproteobacteria bacterium]|nr:branched-chain amino acid ABC transporter permease [Alphaproteobacteria bacterium]
MKSLDARGWTALALILLLVAVPPLARTFDQNFYLLLFTRVVIMTTAAISLNLILGYGGMVSFGHAMYVGIGAYAVGISSFHGLNDGWAQMALAMAVAAVAALAIGAMSLRTKGVYFIMITLAFAQMIYFVAVGLSRYGGDDGLTVKRRSDFGLFGLKDPAVLYYVALAVMLAALWLSWRMVNSRFGLVLRGAKSNDRRMAAIGFATYRYRLAGFVVAGTMCAVAGVLLANFSDFVSPATMHWTRSGDLIVMVVLGGMGSLFGPLFGTVAFLLLEEVLSGITEAWQIIFGPLLLALVLYARGGIDGLLAKRTERGDG